MKTSVSWGILLAVVLALLAYGHIDQLSHYHDFADQQPWLGVRNGKDVCSNIGFVVLGMLGCWHCHHSDRTAWGRNSAFLLSIAMVLTGLGSASYHHQPNDFTLVWDRLPISLICAGLLGLVYSHSHQRSDTWVVASAVWVAVVGVAYWHVSQDLRLYLGLQLFSILVLPYWLWQGHVARPIRLALLWAIVFYILAKVTESLDAPIWQLSHHLISGHTLKHILATASMYMVYRTLVAMLPISLNADADRCPNRKFG